MRCGCWNCNATEGCEGCEDYEGREDLGHEPDPGCVLGDRCINPHPCHQSWECASVEDMEAYEAEALQPPPAPEEE